MDTIELNLNNSFKDNIIELLKAHSMRPDVYQNPHLLIGIVNTIEDVYGSDYTDVETDELISEYITNMFEH